MAPRPVAFLMAQLQRFWAANATGTTAEYLERHIRSPELRTLLATQWGDYGLPPKESAFALHALVVGSYLNGGWFPVGGAGRIARTIEPGIEAAGGAIRVCQEVTEILIENGRAVGVKAIDRRGAEPSEIRYRAPVVISDVGAPLTYERLLPRDGDVGRRTKPLRAALAALKGGVSAVNLYIRLAAPVSTLGVKGENFWINTALDHDDLDAHTQRTLEGEPRHAYLSFPSAKSGDDRFHTAEIITMIRPEAFDAWRGTATGHRGQDYADLKDRISQGLLRMAERAVPGFSALVTYAELSTPLTVEHFTSHPGGAFTACRGRPNAIARRPSACVRRSTGSYLTGTDAASLGVPGALFGGLAAASQVLGSAGFLRIMAAVRRAPKLSAADATARPKEKKRAVVVAKTALTASIWRLQFELDEPLAFVPGQYVKLRVAPFEWRDYSIAASAGRRLTLLISNRTHGDGSNWADAAKVGEATEIEGPLGAYRLERNDRRKVFVATGTGLAPFLSMFEAMAPTGELENAELYFGCRTPDEDITTAFADKPRRTVACVSRAAPPPGGFAGRVTKAIGSLTCDSDRDGLLCLRVGGDGRRLPGPARAHRRGQGLDRAVLTGRQLHSNDELLVHGDRSLPAARDRRPARPSRAQAGARRPRRQLSGIPGRDGGARTARADPWRGRRAPRHEQVLGEPAGLRAARQRVRRAAARAVRPPPRAPRPDCLRTRDARSDLSRDGGQRLDVVRRARWVARTVLPDARATARRAGRRRGAGGRQSSVELASVELDIRQGREASEQRLTSVRAGSGCASPSLGARCLLTARRRSSPSRMSR